MSKAFQGTINVNIRDSVPDGAPFEPPKAPDGAPNVVRIVLDDVGFSVMSCYGGPVETPSIEMNLAGTRRNWPTGRGFERFYGYLGAETNQWYPDLVYDNVSGTPYVDLERQAAACSPGSSRAAHGLRQYRVPSSGSRSA